MSTAVAAQIKAFTSGWGKGQELGQAPDLASLSLPPTSVSTTAGTGAPQCGSSTAKIETGSLPNLLYLMSAWSKDKIKTNYKNVQAIKLDSDEIFSIKPPFIFLTGTRDFKLSDKEVENLQKYVRMGGCIWGDSSLPGLRSRFDMAFRWGDATRHP